MKMNKLEALLPFLQCPTCHAAEIVVANNCLDLECKNCGIKYPISFDRPVMLRKDNDVFNLTEYLDARAPDLVVDKNSIWRSFIPKASINLSSERMLSLFNELLISIPDATVLVVGGGNQRSWLDKRFAANNFNIIYTDIDVDANVDIFCDGHDLPFIDGSIDAIITTAVLEHVLYPERVAEEISRVLKIDGLLYSELPFMQQVHEGAYDYTRYTFSGHKRLFNQFTQIDAGMVAGPGTALVWSIENFVLAFFKGSKKRMLAKVFVRIAFSWVKYFDYLLKDSPEAMDGASCTYFLGVKADQPVCDADIVRGYVGAKHISHT